MTRRFGFVLSVTGVFLLAALLTGCTSPSNQLTLTYGPENKTVTLSPSNIRCSDSEIRGSSVGGKPTSGFSLGIKNEERPTRGMVTVTGSDLMVFTTDAAIDLPSSENSTSFTDLSGTITVSPTNTDELPPADLDNIVVGDGEEFTATLSGTLTCDPARDSRTTGR
ncbi:hypothetical protein [Mycetocola saprophilus]|uniref:hypothetical protein n=1 Tax=Mycetocola saprophilus TaxID=76636 RepID=UPI003BF43D0F